MTTLVVKNDLNDLDRQLMIVKSEEKSISIDLQIHPIRTMITIRKLVDRKDEMKNLDVKERIRLLEVIANEITGLVMFVRSYPYSRTGLYRGLSTAMDTSSMLFMFEYYILVYLFITISVYR